MSHLSDTQLSALLDDALGAAERAVCEAHLAGCEPCRTRLAEYAALDVSVGSALTHDPGDAYFASFAERVGARIAAADTPATTQATTSSWWALLFTSRGLQFAGGTAALVLTAGLAWLSLGQHSDLPGALRGGRSPRAGASAQNPVAHAPTLAPNALTAPGGAAASRADAASENAPPARGEAARSPERLQKAATSARHDQASPSREPSDLRSREVVAAPDLAGTPPEGQTARLDQLGTPENESHAAVGSALAPPSPPSAPAKATTPASETKQRAKAALGAVRALFRDVPSAPRVPAPAALAPKPATIVNTPAKDERQASGGRADELSVLASEQKEQQDTRCGVVRDRTGVPVAGAQVTVVGDHMSSVRSLADGSFCLPASKPGDSLSVLRVGYAPVRMVLTPASSLAIALDPIATLGARSGLTMGGRPALRLSPPPALDSPSAAPARDAFAAQSAAVRASVSAAREVTVSARREHSVAGYEQAAALWQTISTGVSLEPAFAARFQSLSALREAQRLEPSGERLARLRKGLESFVDDAPRTLPERATALRWRSELSGPAAR
jgi:anti-sigma factor RsiW